MTVAAIEVTSMQLPWFILCRDLRQSAPCTFDPISDDIRITMPKISGNPQRSMTLSCDYLINRFIGAVEINATTGAAWTTKKGPSGAHAAPPPCRRLVTPDDPNSARSDQPY